MKGLAWIIVALACLWCFVRIMYAVACVSIKRQGLRQDAPRGRSAWTDDA